MFDKLKADILFLAFLKRPNIDKAYKMVPPTDSWYDTITTVHNSLAEMRKLPHEMVQITSHDSLKMQGIYYPGTSNVTVIWAHGYTSHAEREGAFPGLFYHSLGFNVLIPYQRAHHLSEGKYISFGALEHRDMIGWVNKVNEITPSGSVVLHGLSMGGNVVLDMSDKEIPGVKCIIADAPGEGITSFFHNVSKGVFRKTYQQVYPHLLNRFQQEFGVEASAFTAVEIIKNSRYPIFLTAGSNENIDDFLNDLKAANPMETQVLILPGCNHGNGMYKQTEMYQNALNNFISQYI